MDLDTASFATLHMQDIGVRISVCTCIYGQCKQGYVDSFPSNPILEKYSNEIQLPVYFVRIILEEVGQNSVKLHLVFLAQLAGSALNSNAAKAA